MENISDTFRPSEESNAVAASTKKGDKVLQMFEKRLGLEQWQINGMDRGGCHFPIMSYTQNESRRSADAHERRTIKAVTMQKKMAHLGVQLIQANGMRRIPAIGLRKNGLGKRRRIPL